MNINKKLLNKSDVIVFSPGPGSPKDYPETSKIYNKFKGRKKIIGICLGYQQILHCENAKIIQQRRIFHGYQSEVKVVSNKSIFRKNSKFKVGRYHSLKLQEPFIKENFDADLTIVDLNKYIEIKNEKIESQISDIQEKLNILNSTWESEKKILDTKRNLNERIDQAKEDLEGAQRSGDLTKASEIMYGLLPSLQKEYEELNKKEQATIINEVINRSHCCWNINYYFWFINVFCYN